MFPKANILKPTAQAIVRSLSSLSFSLSRSPATPRHPCTSPTNPRVHLGTQGQKRLATTLGVGIQKPSPLQPTKYGGVYSASRHSLPLSCTLTLDTDDSKYTRAGHSDPR